MKSSNINEYCLRFKRAVESSGEAIFITDPEGIIIYINPEFTKIYGYSSDDIVGKVTPRILKSGEMPDETYKFMWNEVLNRRVVKGEYLNKRKDGSFIFVEGSANSIVNDQEEIIGFLAIQRDITERKQIENRVLESEENFRFLIEDLPTAIMILVESRIVYANNETLRLFKVESRQELLEKSLFNFIHPDYAESVKQKINKTPEEIYELFGTEQEYRRTDGSLVIVEVKMTRTTFGLQPAVQVMLRDITEQKLAERALNEANQLNNQIIQSAREGIIVYDKELKYRVWNNFMENLTGIESSLVIGKDTDELKYVLNDNDVIGLVKKAIQGETTSDAEFEFEINLTGKSGWVSDSVAPLVNASGEIIGVIRTVHDITKRKQSEIEYIHAKNKAEENDRLKTSFLCNMSHEIRTPMNGIYGFSQLLTRSDLKEEKRKLYSESITNCCEQLLDTVNNILDISKIETGQLETDIEVVNLNNLVRGLFVLHNIKASEKGINLLTSSGLPDNNCQVYSDRFKLHQIFNNLLGNALKFTEKGFIKFGYKIIKNRIQFFVEDTGIGIPEESHDIIFERFRQVESGLSRTYGGVGLGLSICKNLVQLLGGDIWVNSVVSEGSVFNFTLPYKSAGINQNSDSVKLPVPNGKLNILIVEDSYFNYIFTRELLSTGNYNCLYAANGREAVDICYSDSSIDLVLMDIRMPVMNGYEALKKIKQNLPGLPVVAQTAYSTEEERDKAMNSGFNGFISKPIKKNELIKAIHKAIGY